MSTLRPALAWAIGLVNRAHAVRYVATRARLFQALLRSLPLPENSTFVDVTSSSNQ